MDKQGVIDAVRQDPDDDSLRLAYAHALEADGQGARAEWVRATCAFAGLPYADPRWQPAVDRCIHTFQECRPPWWELLSNIDQKADRGMFRFITADSRSSRSPTPVKRLGKVPWLGLAYDEGWLHRLELHWDDGELSPVVATWKEPASRIPLFVRPAPQIDDEGLRRVLDLPQLEGIELGPSVLRHPAVMELGRWTRLRDVRIEFGRVDAGIMDAILAQLHALPRLRRLHLKGDERLGHEAQPNDAAVLSLRGATALKRLYLSGVPAVTDNGMAKLREARPDLVVERKILF